MYEPGKREPSALGPPGSTNPDSYYSSAYILFAYRLPWWGLEPYVVEEITHKPANTGDTSLIGSLGLNIHFTPQVQLKLEGGYVHFMDLSGVDTLPTNQDIDFGVLTSRLVMTF